MTPLSPLAKWLAGAAALAGLTFLALTWYQGALDDATELGRTSERAVWVKKESERKEAERLALIDRAKDNAEAKAKQDAINQKVADDHETALAALRAKIARQDAALAAAGGLRVPASICAGPAGPAQATGDGNHDAWLAATRQLPPEIDRTIRAAADDADEIVEQARECQAWVRAHGFYGNPQPLWAE